MSVVAPAWENEMTEQFHTSHRGCEIHKQPDGSFDVYEVGEGPTTTEPYANVPTEGEARLVIDSLFELYQAAKVLAFMDQITGRDS